MASLPIVFKTILHEIFQLLTETIALLKIKLTLCFRTYLISPKLMREDEIQAQDFFRLGPVTRPDITVGNCRVQSHM